MKAKLGWLMVGMCVQGPLVAGQVHPLDGLELKWVRQGWGRAVAGKAVTGKPMMLGGREQARGLGTHAAGECWLRLEGKGLRFRALVGVDDRANGPGTVVFRVCGDDRELWRSPVMKPGDVPLAVDVDLQGVEYLLLESGDAGDGNSFDHANWAGAEVVMAEGAPRVIPAVGDEAVLWTPKPGPQPRVNGPVVYGARPGRPFLYRIPCQGERPMRFSAEGLPAGLVLDAASGIVTGTTPAAGVYPVRLRAVNAHGESVRDFRLVAGDSLALTPPMGWNHWYVHYDRITDTLVRQAADAMVSSGMADVGYQYVNIDDCWMHAPKHADPLRVGPLRDADGRMVPNRHFPDMKGLTRFIHEKGLKAGIYTSPGPFTCGGFAGSFGHEEMDARTFADWGFDFVKYDWCSYGHIAKGGSLEDPLIPHWGETAPTREGHVYPYRKMGALLAEQPRDMVFNLCQYGMSEVWEWGRGVGGHAWRTAGDLGFELDRIAEVAIRNARHRAWNGPGAWNDPDYLQIGMIGNARGMGEPEPCPLSPNEQYTYMSLWALSAAPLIFSGDMGSLDEFTLNVLCNPEVIDVDQDPLGQCGAVVELSAQTFLMVKELADGSKAVGMFNRGARAVAVTAPWAVLGLRGPVAVRDVWRHKDLGQAEGAFRAVVPPRGVVMVRMKDEP